MCNARSTATDSSCGLLILQAVGGGLKKLTRITKILLQDDPFDVLDLTPDNLNTISGAELDELREAVHEIWRSQGSKEDDDSAIGASIVINNEYKIRGRKLSGDKLDEISETKQKTAITGKEETNPKEKFISELKELFARNLPEYELIIKPLDLAELPEIKWTFARRYYPRMKATESQDEFSKKIVRWRANSLDEELLDYVGEILINAIRNKLGTNWDILTYPGMVDKARAIHQLTKWLTQKLNIPYQSLQTQNSEFFNKKVLVIDDIVATGATSRKAIKRLITFKPKRIAFAALARSILHKESFWLVRSNEEINFK